MNQYRYVLLLTLLLQSLPASSEQASFESSYKEPAGFGIGAIIGGLVAGPPGAVIGAAGGTLLGNRDAKRDLTIADLDEKLKNKTIELAYLQKQFAETQSQYEEFIQKATVQHRARSLQKLSEGVSYSVYFRTGKSDIDTLVTSHIRELAGLIKDLPEISILVEAYADQRGNWRYNQKLSESRASAVEIELVNSGIPTSRIRIHAYGESRARVKQGDREGYVFDRRVEIHLTTDTEV